jgi:Ion transport protein
VLGAGFEEIVSRENRDNTRELERNSPRSRTSNLALGSLVEQAVYKFIRGIGSPWAVRFELSIYGLILLSVAVGAWQTVAGQETAFQEIEYFAVVVFTVEYVLRLIAVGADPRFSNPGGNAIASRMRFLVSFYSIIDLLAIVPFYVTLALPNSVVNDYDEYLRMLRILRLVKLDKYVPSITLIGTFHNCCLPHVSQCPD